MDPRLKSLLTLSVLGVLLLVGAVWGLSAITQPFPGRADAPVCVDVSFAQGERITRSDVTVSVLNAGTRNGLAGLTMDLFVDAGFGEGQEGNSEGGPRVRTVEIWTEEPRHPAVLLVARQLGDAVEVVRREPTTAGVQVVVGDGFDDLVRGPRSIVARTDVEVCGASSDVS
ncbi:MAG: LytR C-terminal domain-containing protein [Nocardioides sp.]